MARQEKIADTIGIRLGDLRISENPKISQKELAIRIGVGRTSISHYEDGNYAPSLETLIKLADYFNVSIDYLVGRSDLHSIEQTKLKISNIPIGSLLNRIEKLNNEQQTSFLNLLDIIEDSENFEILDSLISLVKKAISINMQKSNNNKP